MKNSLFGSSTSIRIVLDDAKSVAKDGKAGEMDLIEIPSSKAENFKGRHEDLGISDFASPTPAQIKGRVILSLGKQLNHATELSIRLWGSISLDATGVMHWVSPDVHTVQAIKNIVVDNTVVLWRKSSSKTALNTASGSFEAGQYEYPFTIHLPGDTPPSINVSYGTIKYYVRARLARSGINPDVCSSTKPLAITRTRAPNMTLQEQEFETRFHRIKVHFPEEIPADAKYVKVSTEISVLDRDAIDCLAAVKLAFVERRAYSCGIPNKKLMYKEETVFGKGAKHAIKDPRNTFESNRSNGISEQQLHAELNFPLAASRLPAVLPPPLRFSMNVPVEGANVSFRTHDFRIAHRLLIRLDMDTTVWGGDRNFKLDIPACVVSVAQNHTPMYKKPSYAESTFSAMGGTSCSASIASGISYISSTNTSTDNIKIKDALGIAIPGDAVSRISSAENLKANIHGGHSLMNYRHIDKNMDERVEALVDSAQDKCEFSVGSFSVKAARSLINSPTSPKEDFGVSHIRGESPTFAARFGHADDGTTKTSRSRSTSGASSKLGGHVQLPLTPESMDEHESPPRVMMVTPPTPTLHPSKSMPFLKSKDGKQEEPIKEEETIEGRSRSASANELSQTQSYPFLAVDPVSTRSSPSNSFSESHHHYAHQTRERTKSGSSSTSSIHLYRGFTSAASSPIAPSSPSLSERSDSISSIHIDTNTPRLKPSEPTASRVKPSIFKMPIMKTFTNMLSGRDQPSLPAPSIDSTPSAPFNTTSSSRRFRPSNSSNRSISPFGKSMSSEDVVPRLSVDSMRKGGQMGVPGPAGTPRRSVDERRHKPSAYGVPRKSLDGRPSEGKVKARQESPPPLPPPPPRASEEEDPWALVDGVYEFVD